MKKKRKRKTRRSTASRPKMLIYSPLFVMLASEYSRVTTSNHRIQIGSAVLFGLYLIVKYFGKEWITWLLQWYFTFAGIGSFGKVRRAALIMSYRMLTLSSL